MGTFYGYQLTLSFYKNGAPVKDYTSGSAADFCAKFNNYTDTRIAYKKGEIIDDSADFGVMNLSSLSYRKQLYSPNRIDASIECSAKQKGSMLELAGLFKEARAKLEVAGFTETEDGSGNKTISVDGTDAKLIADKYEVYESSPRYDASQEKMYIDLVMYSPDKVLDTFEYSKAYTNKRLGLDIFSNEAAAISSNLGLECKNMQVLRLESGEEFIQPYLVQYNETFYSFLSRLANRCGEFLYYDDIQGKLSLGIKSVPTVSGVKDTDNAGNLTDSDFDKISFTDFNTSHNRNEDSEDFYSNYMVEDTKTPAKSFVRSSELSGDEYYETVEKGKFSSAGDERKYVGYGLYHTVGTLFTHTMGAGLFLAGVNLLMELKIDADSKADAVNDHFNEKFFKNDDTDSTKLLFGSENAITSVSDGKVNVNSVFYPLVRDKEMACNRSQVSLRISSDISKNVMLGDRINFFDKEYVVVKVTASFNVVVNSDGSTTVRQPVDVIAVPVEGAPMPTCSVAPIRKAGCQKAFVTDVDDPSFLGRVRVRFSWQKKDDDSSPWIRVCTQMANSNGGAAFFKAAVGDSVLIDFENGNADMPYVAGFLPTMDQQKNKGQYLTRRNSVVVSSENGQMMLMSDPSKGDSLIGDPALSVVTKLLPGLPSDDASNTRFLGSTEFTDYYGVYSVKMSSSDRSVTIDSPFGKVAMNAFTGISINAPNGDISIAGKNITLTAGNNITIESGVNAKPSSTRYFADLILGAVGDYLTDTLMPKILDLSYIRNVLEIFIKPCEGTLSLQSGRYLLMRAGGAVPKVPFTGFVIPQKGMVNFDPERDKIAALLNALNFIDGVTRTVACCISEMSSALKETQETWKKKFFYVDARNETKPMIKTDGISVQILANRVNIPENEELILFKSDDKFALTLDCLTEGPIVYWDPYTKYLAKTANDMVKKLRASGLRVKAGNEFLEVSNSGNDVKPFIEKLLRSAKLGAYESKMKTALEDVLINQDLSSFDIKANRRKIAKSILEFAISNQKVSGICNPRKPYGDVTGDKEWIAYVTELFAGEHLGFFSQIGASAYNTFKTVVDKLNPIQQLTGKWAQGGRKWSAEGRGQILMSDTEGTTMYFNNGTLKSFSNSDLYAVRTYCKKFL